MPSPTQDDIDYLRAHPDGAASFEAHFGIPASEAMRDPAIPKPTENDITTLKKANLTDPTARDQFEAHFGPGTASEHLREPTELELYQSLEDKDAAKNGPPSLLTRLGRAPQRFGTASRDLLGNLFDPRNIGNAAAAAGDVISRVPDIVGTPEGRGELMRGAYQGIGTIPGQLSDLALAGMDRAAQITTGAKPLVKYNPDAYTNNPIGAASNEAMLEDWGNKATDAVGLGDKAFDFSDPGTDTLRTARAIGGYGAQAAVMGGPKAIVPGVTGAIGSEVAREVAPDQPNWQPIGGGIGAALPGATMATFRGIGAGMRAAASSPAARQFTAGGRSVVAGDTIRAAAGEGFDPNAPLPPNPLADVNAEILRNAAPDQPPPDTFQPTTGQITGNKGILALEKSQAMGAPDISRQFADRQSTNQAVARTALTGLRGTGLPEDLRNVAERAMAIANDDVIDAGSRATTGLSQSQAGMAARKQIVSARQSTRETRQALWNDPAIKNVPVEIDPLREQLKQYFQDQGPAYGDAMPPDVQATLDRLGKHNTLINLQNVRSSLGNYARDAAGKNDSNMARVYGDLRDITGKYIDNQEFPDNPDAATAYGKARAYSLLENQLYRQPDEMRAVLGKNRFGGQTVAPAETLQQFIKPGPAGLDTVNQLLATNNTPEMHNAIGDHLYDVMTTKGNKVKDGVAFLRQYADTLNQLPIVKGKLEQVVAKRAAAEALAKSPLSKFVGSEPGPAVDRLFASSDRIRAVRHIRSQLMRIDPSGKAWDGLKAATVDKILRTVSSAIELDADKNPTVMPGVMNKFYRQNADILHEILGTQASGTVGSVADAMEMMSRTARSGKEYGSPTAPALAGDRFLDHMLEKYVSSSAGPLGSGAALGGAGFAVGGIPGAAAGAGIGVAGHLAFSSAKAEVANLLARALLNPEEGKAMMQPAAPASIRALPRAVQPYFKKYIPSATAATNAQKPATEKKPLKVGQTVSGIIDGAKVVWKYLGGDPKAQASWAKQ